MRHHSVLIFSLLLSLCGGCTVLQLPDLSGPISPPQAYAEQLYINGEFENALLEYEHIYETALSPEDKNNALYGLACTQMMLAQSVDQLVEAISNLQKWDANKGTEPFRENRHLLVLALKQQSMHIKEQHNKQIKIENQKNSLIADQQLKILQMTSTAEKRLNQIKKLQTQIEELEAIDENVQEKRQPL